MSLRVFHLKCEDVELPREWGLTKAESRFVRLLLGKPIATYERIMSALWWDKADGPPDTAHNSISIRVCRIRQKIPLLRDGLKNVHGQGYELTDAARREIGVLRVHAGGAYRLDEDKQAQRLQGPLDAR